MPYLLLPLRGDGDGDGDGDGGRGGGWPTETRAPLTDAGEMRLLQASRTDACGSVQEFEILLPIQFVLFFRPRFSGTDLHGGSAV